MRLEFIVDKEMLVKEYIREMGISRNLGRKIKLYGNIYINGQASLNYDLVHIGDLLVIKFEESENDEIISSPGPLEIIHEDEYFMIIVKPVNLSTQPSRKHPDNLISRVKYHFELNNIKSNVHVITRLDLATSGLMIVVKSAYITEKFSKINIKKLYLAEVEGHFESLSGEINLAIKRINDISIKREINSSGQTAITKYKLLKQKQDTSILELELVTGRTHQIRLHLNALGYPIVGDLLYNNRYVDTYKEESAKIEEMKLHAYYLEFTHPVTKESLSFINYPKWFNQNN